MSWTQPQTRYVERCQPSYIDVVASALALKPLPVLQEPARAGGVLPVDQAREPSVQMTRKASALAMFNYVPHFVVW
ncbi:hypothetical protein MVEG_11604 [Podila verticillata NRRL 6337]|uniref:Uncharacterized protein n=1 Tax=Podila verticillata NRRL 6337 TaxID=1069443 RepID=A0A086TKB8_9FUNG|nr:hypothetical protein MVEG_11604 [Podila verticillata NRRL 6337]